MSTPTMEQNPDRDLDRRVGRLEGIAEQLDKLFDSVDKHFDAMDKRLDRIEATQRWIIGLLITSLLGQFALKLWFG